MTDSAGDATTPPAADHRLTILHTNDFHSHLTEAQAARLRAMRTALGSRGLLLDAGDAISAGNVTYRPGGEPILDLMSDSGYDAMAVGNREFHFTRAGFRAKLSRARFPVLCANVRGRDPESTVPTRAFASFIAAGLRVTVVGLTVPMITERMKARVVSAYVFDDPFVTAAELVPRLRPESDLLVCLTHIGLAKDRELAVRVPGIDVVIGGHTHAHLEHGERIGGTLVVQAGWWGHFLGCVVVERTTGGLHLEAKTEPL